MDGQTIAPFQPHTLRRGAELGFGSSEPWTVASVDPPAVAIPERTSEETALPDPTEPRCWLAVFVSSDGREIDVEVGDGVYRAPLRLSAEAAALIAHLEQRARRDRARGLDAQDAGWVAVDELASREGVTACQVEARLKEVDGALASSGLVLDPHPLRQREGGSQVQLLVSSSRSSGADKLATVQSSEMTALERTLYLAPPEGLLNHTFGYPEGLTPDWISAICGRTSVATRTGTTSLQRIEDHFRDCFGLDRVLLTTTASEALLVAIRTAVEKPGDEILLLENGFDAYPGLVEMCGAVPRFIGRAEHHRLDPDAIAQAMGPRTAAVLLTSPDNPTGVIHSAEALGDVGRRCAARGVPLILDGAFHEVAPFGVVPARPSAWAPPSLDLMVVGDTGKLLGLEGSKLGALLVTSALEGRIAAVADNLFFQLPSYKLAVFAEIFSDPRFPAYHQDFLATLRANFESLRSGVGPALKVLESQGSSMALVDVSGTGVDGKELADRLLSEERVAVVPCSMFARGSTKPLVNLVRLAMARAPSTVAETARRMARLADRLVAGR